MQRRVYNLVEHLQQSFFAKIVKDFQLDDDSDDNDDGEHEFFVWNF